MRKKVREMIEILEADGWFLSRQKGTYKQYKYSKKKNCDHSRSW